MTHLLSRTRYVNIEIDLQIDFTNASAVDHVNQWVSDKTNGKIPRLFDSLDANTVLALTSAIYFKVRKW